MELWSDESQAASNLNTQLFSSGWDWTWGDSTFKEMVWGELSPAGGGTRAVRTRPTRKQISILWVTLQEPIQPYFINIFFDSCTTLEGWALRLYSLQWFTFTENVKLRFEVTSLPFCRSPFGRKSIYMYIGVNCNEKKLPCQFNGNCQNNAKFLFYCFLHV